MDLADLGVDVAQRIVPRLPDLLHAGDQRQQHSTSSHKETAQDDWG